MFGCRSRATASASTRNRARRFECAVAPADDHLEGDQAIQANLAGLVDDPHPSLAERLEELIAGNLGATGRAAIRVLEWHRGRGTSLADRFGRLRNVVHCRGPRP